MESLTAEQKLFLEECETEFWNRYTDSDLEYKIVREAGIPPPPIMFPWYPKPTQRYRGGGRGGAGGANRYSNYRQDRSYDRHTNQYNSYKQEDRRHR